MDTAENRLKMLQSSGRGKHVKENGKEQSSASGSKLRFMLAMVFFLTFYVLQQKGLGFLGITGEKIYETVCENAKGFDFVLEFPYTLDD